MTLIKDIRTMWAELYRTNKILFWLGAIGTISSIAASLVLNFGLPDPNMMLVLVLYTIGSITLSITSYYNKDSWMVLLMNWYTIINLIGMIRLTMYA